MDEKLESKQPIWECSVTNSIGQYVTLGEGEWINPVYGTKDRRVSLAKEDENVYRKAAKKGIEPDKKTGLFFDSIAEYEKCDAMPILDHSKSNDGVEETMKQYRQDDEEQTPEIVTLEEKVIAHSSYKKVLALAGVAVRHQNNMFDDMEKHINELKRDASHLLNYASMLEKDLKNLKRLAVLD